MRFIFLDFCTILWKIKHNLVNIHERFWKQICANYCQHFIGFLDIILEIGDILKNPRRWGVLFSSSPLLKKDSTMSLTLRMQHLQKIDKVQQFRKFAKTWRTSRTVSFYSPQTRSEVWTLLRPGLVAYDESSPVFESLVFCLTRLGQSMREVAGM